MLIHYFPLAPNTSLRHQHIFQINGNDAPLQVIGALEIKGLHNQQGLNKKDYHKPLNMETQLIQATESSKPEKPKPFHL
jgi:hypothetical protein